VLCKQKHLQKRFSGTFVLKKQKRLTKRFGRFFVCKQNTPNTNKQKSVVFVVLWTWCQSVVLISWKSVIWL